MVTLVEVPIRHILKAQMRMNLYGFFPSLLSCIFFPIPCLTLVMSYLIVLIYYSSKSLYSKNSSWKLMPVQNYYQKGKLKIKIKLKIFCIKNGISMWFAFIGSVNTFTLGALPIAFTHKFNISFMDFLHNLSILIHWFWLRNTPLHKIKKILVLIVLLCE
jgi:hypothetical protein